MCPHTSFTGGAFSPTLLLLGRAAVGTQQGLTAAQCHPSRQGESDGHAVEMFPSLECLQVLETGMAT